MAGHEDARVMTGHIGTNTPKFVRPRRGRPPLDPTQTGLCKFGWVWSSLIPLVEPFPFGSYALARCLAIAVAEPGGTDEPLGPVLRPR